MDKKRTYSGFFIINPDKEEAINDVTEAIKNYIRENKGDVAEERVVGKKKLSYLIGKKEQGIYFEVTFSAPPSSIEKISRLCRINTDILRTVIDSV